MQIKRLRIGIPAERKAQTFKKKSDRILIITVSGQNASKKSNRMETDELQDCRRGAIMNKGLQSPAKADGREKHAFYGGKI